MKGQSPTFKQFNDEINDFYKYLKDNKFSDEEIKKIFSPYLDDNFKKTKLVIISILLIFLTVTVLYFLTNSETVSWHFSALGRILLIKLLPFWDWTVLKNEKCLITKASAPTVTETNFNCDLCENIAQIDVFYIDDISEDILRFRYLELDTPVIIRDNDNETQKWLSSTSFIQNLLQNDEIASSKPCRLSTNIQNGETSVKNLLTKTKIFDRFYIHFQNCDREAMKQFRVFTPKPQFVPVELSPVQYNWLFWSKNYNVSNFKMVKLVDKISLIRQVFGSTLLRLIPRNNCEDVCPILDIKLTEGEYLMLTSLWNLEYKPQDGENIAVILEMH